MVANERHIRLRKPWEYPTFGHYLQMGPVVIVGFGLFELEWVVPGHEEEAATMREDERTEGRWTEGRS